eukprot:jgi/Botrbrau1/1616/Bobra.0185s0031.1
MVRPRFVVFGDSLTQQSFRPGGWGSALADAYARKADIVLRGYSGYNTRWAQYLLPSIFSTDVPPPELVIVFFGANDAAIPDHLSSRQHVPVEEYMENLRKIVLHLRSINVRQTVLISPPPVGEEGRVRLNQEMQGRSEKTLTPERTNAYTRHYAEACKAVAAELGVPVLDLWTKMQEQTEWESAFLSDGLHFTPAGNQFLFDNLQELISTSMPHLKAETMADDFPPHLEIDTANPAAAFN